jgi:hypothetical protein
LTVYGYNNLSFGGWSSFDNNSTQVDASSVNRDIPEKIRVDAYMEIKRLLKLEEKVTYTCQ